MVKVFLPFTGKRGKVGSRDVYFIEKKDESSLGLSFSIVNKNVSKQLEEKPLSLLVTIKGKYTDLEHRILGFRFYPETPVDVLESDRSTSLTLSRYRFCLTKSNGLSQPLVRFPSDGTYVRN